MRSEPRQDERRALLRDLADDGCLVCRDADQAEHHWHTWYVMETHRDPDYRRRAAQGGGFCGRHTRLLMSTPDGVRVLPGLLNDVIATPLASRRCDACAKRTTAAERRLETIARWLHDPAVSFATGHLCSPHLLDLLASAPWQHAKTLAEHQQFAAPSDTDLPVRAPHVAAVAKLCAEEDEQLTELSTVDRAITALGRACCPACRARFTGEARYLSWLLRQDLERLDPGEPWLCPDHLGDASVLDDQSAARIRELMHWNARARLARLTDRLAAAPRPQLPARLRKAWPALRHRRYDLLAAALRRPNRVVTEAISHFRHVAPSCSVCTAGTVGEGRELALLDAAARQETVREHWARGHGLCRDHAPLAAPDLSQQVLRSRLAVLAWELDETLRRQAWRTRHEPATPAQDSWPRAVPFLCGSAFLGRTPAEYLELP
ncbi:hypothetical protein DMP23_19760 [Amycolatopsis sp. A1MSW2902]|uniref:hypothetical protein n=1 Tax=Amycolatopsis sp. A1MSW2902 TaxID=687413 RepID=UPI00307F3DCA